MPQRKAGEHRPPPVVVYTPVGELKIYEISEAELEKLEAGPPGQIHLSFALALLPVAVTVLITIQTVLIVQNRLYYGYLIAFWVFLVQGMISLVQWYTKSRDFKRLVADIRGRMPAKPGIAEQLLLPGPVADPEARE